MTALPARRWVAGLLEPAQGAGTGACAKCQRGDHRHCWGYDGPMTTHPDSLPLCTCDHQEKKS